MFAFCAGVKAQTVTVADVDALPGETVAFTLDLTGGKANTYTAMQFDAQFPVTGFSTTGQYSVSDLWMNATATVGSVNVDGIATIPVASSESISASDVKGLFSVSFTVDGGVAVGDYDVTLKNLWFGYGTSSKDYLADVTFTVHVVNVHSVVLDENSTTVPESAEGVNVTVKRTINAGEWSTICLPFAMTAAQCQAAFGSDVQIGDFTGCTVVDDNVSVNFSNVTAMEANHPYIIKVSSAVSEFTVDGVDIAADNAEVKVNKSGRKYNRFIGNYENGTELEDGFLFLNANKFYFSNGSTKIKAFRGYFNLETADAYYEESRRIALVFGETTAIDNGKLTMDNEAGAIYDLSGRKVSNGQLKKGLYIKNGKKVVVK